MSVLVIAPHPDDECIGCGGMILNRREHNIPVHVLYITGTPPRLEEVTECSTILSTTWSCLQIEDGEVKPTRELEVKIASISQHYTEVYIPNKYEKHPDHVAVWTSAVNGIPNDKLISYEIWTPLRHPTHMLDITPYLSLKRAAIRCHTSQMVNAFDESIIALNRYRGVMSGSNTYAMEAFRRHTS